MKPESVKQQAREMRAAGATYRAIAEACGVSMTSAKVWTNPDYAEKRRQRDRLSAEDRAAAFTAFRDLQRKYILEKFNANKNL